MSKISRINLGIDVLMQNRTDNLSEYCKEIKEIKSIIINALKNHNKKFTLFECEEVCKYYNKGDINDK